MILIGGQRPRTARASFNPSIEPGIWISVKTTVMSRRASRISPMPDGLANALTREEIWDLIAYLESGGRRDYGAFQK